MKALCAISLAVLPVLTPGGGAAQSVVSTGESFLHATLVPGEVNADGTRTAGLVLDLAPGWKTYWRSPGAAGVPPQFDWSKSQNLENAEVLWPRPVLFDSFGMTAIGYTERVVLPLRLMPAAADAAIEVNLDLSLGLCRDICVLEETKLSLSLDPGVAGEGTELVRAAEALVPRPGDEQGLASATCRIAGAGARRSFDATVDFGRPLTGATVILEGPELAWFDDVETSQEESRLRVTAALGLMDEGAWVSRQDIRMTVLADGLAADIRGCAAPAG